uniref:hypothetical protein n=2 Tax=uncultured Desulfovibrio sp. TaxID=167968 RepID=UPI00263AB0FE
GRILREAVKMRAFRHMTARLEEEMSSFVFCLIFIQVSIFFIAGFLGLTSLYCVWRDRRRGAPVAVRSVSRNRFRRRRTGMLPPSPVMAVRD